MLLGKLDILSSLLENMLSGNTTKFKVAYSRSNLARMELT